MRQSNSKPKSTRRADSGRRIRCFGLSVSIICLIMLALAGQLQASPPGRLVIGNGTTVRALDLVDQRVRWAIDAGLPVGGILIVPGGSESVVLAAGSGLTVAFDARTGVRLWTRPGYVEDPSLDIHRRLYANPIQYPHGPPNLGGGPAPDILINYESAGVFLSALVDSRSGMTITTWEDASGDRSRASGFLPRPDGSYDVMFVSEEGGMRRMDAADGRVVWERDLPKRWGIPVPDVNGDGQYEWFAAPSYYSDVVIMLDGATGADIWSEHYGAFDVIETPQVVAGSDGYDVIVSAQNSKGGGIRRYHAPRLGKADQVVWEGPATFRNNTIVGLLPRSDGLTVISHWRHERLLIALDADTGMTLWDDVPGTSAVGVSDLTDDGSDDLLVVLDSMATLYDAVSGEPIETFAPILINGLAYDPTFPPLACNRPHADADADGDVDQADFGAFQLCISRPEPSVHLGSEQCECFDRDNDLDVDLDDFGRFQRCISGPGIPADPACDAAE